MTPRSATLLVWALCGCATAPLDRTTLRGSEAVGRTVDDVPVHGFQAAVSTIQGEVEGELFAVDGDVLWLGMASGRAYPIDRRSIVRVRVQVADTSGGAFAAWTTVGSLSTATHGYFTVLTTPLWLLFGVTTSVLESGSGRADAGPTELALLRPYTRFPQGLPASLRGVAPAAPAPLTPPPAPPPQPGGGPDPGLLRAPWATPR